MEPTKVTSKKYDGPSYFELEQQIKSLKDQLNHSNRIIEHHESEIKAYQTRQNELVVQIQDLKKHEEIIDDLNNYVLKQAELTQNTNKNSYEKEINKNKIGIKDSLEELKNNVMYLVEATKEGGLQSGIPNNNTEVINLRKQYKKVQKEIILCYQLMKGQENTQHKRRNLSIPVKFICRKFKEYIMDAQSQHETHLKAEQRAKKYKNKFLTLDKRYKKLLAANNCAKEVINYMDSSYKDCFYEADIDYDISIPERLKNRIRDLNGVINQYKMERKQIDNKIGHLAACLHGINDLWSRDIIYLGKLPNNEKIRNKDMMLNFNQISENLKILRDFLKTVVCIKESLGDIIMGKSPSTQFVGLCSEYNMLKELYSDSKGSFLFELLANLILINEKLNKTEKQLNEKIYKD